MNATATAPAQPQIPAAYKLLAASVDYDGFKLDLYGTFDADGYEVCAVAPTGTTIDLEPILGAKVCDRMTAWCERTLPSGAELRAQSKAEARITRHEFDREFSIGVAA